jgi:DNA-binding MarR family transcriptional regulator
VGEVRLMSSTIRILRAIGCTNRVYADDFVKNLGSPPIPTSEMFVLIKTLEEQQLVTTVRSGHDGIISLSLTPLGLERAQEAQQEACR